MKVMQDTITKLTVPTPFAVGDVHLYLLKGDTLSLVDAGVRTKEAWEALTIQLKEIGYRPIDIEQHIITHHHPDHIGLIGEFPRAKAIAGHKYNEPWLRQDTTYFEIYQQFYRDFLLQAGVPINYAKQIDKLANQHAFLGKGTMTHFLDEGDRLPGHEEWEVIETKGHAQSHLSFFRKADGALIAGDHLLKHITPNPIIEPPHAGETERPKPLLQYRKNLEKCLQLGIQTVYPGHGENFTNLDELLPGWLDRQEKRAEKVYQIIGEKTMTPFAICQQLFPTKFKREIDLTMSETIGQLDYLLAEGRVELIHQAGVQYFRIKQEPA